MEKIRPWEADFFPASLIILLCMEPEGLLLQVWHEASYELRTQKDEQPL
jgi:hypothetical protein